ncbi:uncharacterized protein FOMMEDRAFT_170411 [Fomitiporia mediterranea MF3/22]|uniref:uncharacterized protein n=1 Tax=Fomitiporia mediterranea (strain MF3/22) TaxID=694068 RepID=UPI00044096E5|nr:uncharacterized protein FOMMEDRAFT_170411 [Fomitiporia mediterranea MF3/22]EJC99393.1 hypothetical protein FOMMEDRAFT_170411 [Fomitiporia mediterranea MF3/22]
MNARWVCRDLLLLRSISRPRQKAYRPPGFRCIATVQSNPAADVAGPPPPLGRLLQDDVNDKRATTADSATNGARSHSPLSDIFGEEAREELDEQSLTRATQGQQAEQRANRFPCVYILPEVRLLNFPGILSLIRELERRFGSVREFKILRDKDSPNAYVKTLFVIFRDQDSAKRLDHVLQGKQSGRIMVPAPTDWDDKKDLNGGVGLEDIQPFLRPADTGSAELVTVTDQDRQMENVASSVVEKILAETNTNGWKEGTPPDSVDLCEVRIEMLNDGFTIEPIARDVLRTWQTREHRIHSARAFARWGGFYPHYLFSPYSDEEGQIVLGGKVVDNLEELTERQRQQAETVRLATNSMRDALVSARLRLKNNDEPDHGLVERDGRQVVLDWEASASLGSVEGTTAVSDIDATPVENAEGSTSRAGGVSTSFEPNVPVTEAEETRNARQFLTSSDVRSEATTTSSDEKTERTISENSKPSSSQHSPTPFSKDASVLQEPESSERISQATPQQSLSPSTQSMNASQDGARAAPAEVMNNRTRRARKKAEQERAGFKAKLLGWLGR